MVSTESNFEHLAKLYRDLILDTLLYHDVKEVVCKNDNEHYFDRIVINDGNMKVYKYGLEKPWNGLYFDFTLDYARCLSYIESDLYLVRRKGNPEHGMIFTFNS